jgi:uncharacterized repeat protein (TIGR03803 family)
MQSCFLETLEDRRLLTATLTTLATFPTAGPSGSIPETPLAIDAAGDLSGTTDSGGANGGGTVFKVAAGSHKLSTLAPFVQSGEELAGPTGKLVVDAAGDVFGADQNGGANFTFGEVYEVVAGSGQTTTLEGFPSAGPQGGFVGDVAGNLYGTRPDGTVYELAGASHTYEVLATLPAGATPRGDLAVDPTGNLYGATTSGGSAGLGSIFEVNHATHVATTLASFTGATTGGTEPEASSVIRDAAGDLFGITYGGGSDYLTRIFELPVGSHAIRTVATFPAGEGPQSAAGQGLVIDAAGDLFGTSAGGTADPDGSVFEIAAGSSTIGTVYAFPTTGAAGRAPLAGLTVGAAGNLYGTTSGGGPGGGGTVFELSGAGVRTVVYTVNGTVVTDLRNRTTNGSTVTATFLLATTDTRSLAAYTAPAARFSAATASQQKVYREATGTFVAGVYTLSVAVPPSGHYQVDFVMGGVITKFGAPGSDEFYMAQDRLISSDNE